MCYMTKVQRYKVGFFQDEWGMSSITPCLIPDDSGFAVKFEDYCKLETELAALKAENESLRKDAERYRWLRDATGETPLRPAAFGNEMYPDMRLKLDFPTIVSYDAVGNVTTLDQAIDAMAKGE